VASSFNNSYDYPLMALIGSITQVDAQYNYKRDGSTFCPGCAAPPQVCHRLLRVLCARLLESKVQPDHNLWLALFTLFAALGNGGLEVDSDDESRSWFNVRGQHQSQGIGAWADPTVSFNLAGPRTGGSPVSITGITRISGRGSVWHGLLERPGGCWEPIWRSWKSSIRAGFGIVYDPIGQGLLATFDRRGAFGMSTTLTNQAAIETMVRRRV